MKRLVGRRGVAAAFVVVVAIAVGGIAYASIPDSNGVIHGCYKTVGGSLRVIDNDAGATCNGAETPLNWSQTGPQGPQGEQGPTGEQGPQGEQGPPGSSATRLWAQVLPNGALYAGHGVEKVYHEDGSGIYQIEFNQPVKGCAAVATFSLSVGPEGKLIADTYSSYALDDNMVAVLNWDTGDHGFQVAVFC